MGERARNDASRAGSGRPRRALHAIKGFLSDGEAMGFHRLVNERVRLGILSALAVNRTASFTELKALLETSDGNLSAHARKLEAAGLISSRKFFVERTPRTEFALTARGRRAFENYLDHMEALIDSTRQGDAK